MVYLPLLKQLRVADYGLYPVGGTNVLEIDLSSPMFLMVGANGLGKSTLIRILLRTLTGPFDISAKSTATLGRANLGPREVPREERRIFASRVSDGATESTVQLEMSLSDHTFTIVRALRDLTLLGFKRDDVDQLSGVPVSRREAIFQRTVVEASGIGNYSDWLLLLRYVTFFQDERRPLLWDGFAQSQVLRPLYLGRDESNQWLADEREILVKDSYRRNLSSVLSGREQLVTVEQNKLTGANDVRNRLAEISERLAVLREKRLESEDEAQTARASRADARLAVAQAEAAAESSDRAYQHAKLQSIAASFPSIDATAAYVVSLLATNNACVLCGKPSNDLLDQVNARMDQHECVVCGNTLTATNAGVADLGTERYDAAVAGVELARELLATARAQSDVETARTAAADQELLLIEKELSDLELEEAELLPRLPADAQALREELNRVSGMRTELHQSGEELERLRANFESFVAGQTKRIFAGAAALRAAFDEYAREFLVEESLLSWSPRLDAVGQSGQKIPFPQFSVALTNNGGGSSTERLTAESVSESQRQYIDLAFRMALVQTATSDGRGTIVIDSPESTLDAVFEPRAANQLIRFVKRGTRTLFLVSNITSGDFLPTLLAARNNKQPLAEAADLLDIALPTAATRDKRAEYARAFADLYERATVLRKQS